MEAPPELDSLGLRRELACSAAERPHVPVDGGVHDDVDDDDDGADSDEDFAFAVPESCSFDGPDAEVTADEIFSNGLIRPAYPLFDRGPVSDDARKKKEQLPLQLRELALDDSRNLPSSSSPWESHDVEGLPAGGYCAWAPRSAPTSPDLRRKSRSAGAAEASKRWRLFDLVMGRSHSDGKERLVFLHDRDSRAGGQQKKKTSTAGVSAEAAGKKGSREKGKGGGGAGHATTEMDMATAHRLFYARGTGAAPGDRRRSFLPYRKDLLGFFGNVNSHGSFQPW